MKLDYQKILGIVTLTTFILLEVFSPASTFAQENQPENQTIQVPVEEPSSEPTNKDVPPVPDENIPVDNTELEDENESLDNQASEEKEEAEPESEEDETMNREQAEESSSANSLRDQINSNVNTINGSLLYNYKITVPPGRNGIEPTLSLRFSSQYSIPGSIFGDGWDINIPYIERANKFGVSKLYSTSSETYFYSTVSGDLATTSTSTIYYAESDSGNNLKYSFSSNQWIVTDKEGTIYKYGSSTSARQDDPANASSTARWMLEEVKDTNNNYITYEYYKNNGQIYPSTIKYTRSTTTDGIFEVEFLREARTKPVVTHDLNFTATTTYRIYEIQAKINGSWVRKYTLSYTTGDNGDNQLLSQIVESGKDESGTTVTLPAQTFAYQAPAHDFTTFSSDTIPVLFAQQGIELSVRVVDVNGDALPDLIKSYLGLDQTGEGVYLNNGDNTWTLSGWDVPVLLKKDNLDLGVKTVDINNDGLADIVRSFDGGGLGYTGEEVYINNGSGWTLDSSWDVPELFATQGVNLGVELMDVNGDHLPDLVKSFETSNSSFSSYNGNKVYLNTGHAWVLDTSWSIPEVFVRDFNLLDLGVRFGDSNGDGLIDILKAYSGFGYDGNTVYINTGHGWQKDASSTIPIVFKHQGQDMFAQVVDFNGDGLVDIIKSFDGYYEFDGQAIYINNGNNTWTEDSSWAVPELLGQDSSDLGVRFVDVNGDGLPDTLRSFSGYSLDGNRIKLNKGEVADLLKSTTNPLGGKLTFAYKGSPEYKDESNDIGNPALPYLLQTINQIGYNDTINTTASTTYTYLGADLYYGDPFDTKIGGFNQIHELGPTGFVTDTFYHQGNNSASTTGEYSDDRFKIGRPYRVEVYDASDNLYTKTINKWETTNRQAKANFVTLTQSVSSTYDGDSDHKDKAESYTYDFSTGNITSKTQWGEVTGSNNGTFSDTGTDKLLTSISYATSSPIYLPSQEITFDYSSVKISESKYYYDTLTFGSVLKGNLTKKEQRKTASTFVDFEKSYNNYGLVSSEKDPRDKVTSYTFDTYNLYPATSTNPLSQTTAFWFDYSAGKPKQVKDANGLIFQISYDGLDRPLEEKQPDLTTPTTLVTKTEYQYTDNTVPTKIKKIDYLSSATSTDSYIYSDGFGRQIQTRKEAEGNNTYAVKDTVYNNLGLVDKESLPYFASSTANTSPTGTASLYTTYSYDTMNRPVTITNNLGATTNTYDDWKLTITDPDSKVKDIFKDAYGRILSVVEHISTTTPTTAYEYDGLGNLSKITDAEANIRNFTYDYLNQRLTAQDLHNPGDSTYGSWSFVYDDTGNVIAQYQPDAQLINYGYDDINRVITEDYTTTAGNDVTYKYDSCTYGIGKLCFATSTFTTQTAGKYAYNPLGLRSSETKILDNLTFTTTYEYDRQGNMTGITHPDGLKVSYNYDAAGLPDTIPPYITSIDYSPLGQPKRVAFGNGVVTTNTYDATKLYRLTNKKTISGATTLQDLTYTYSAAGDVTKIVDASQTNTAKTADYTYDDLHRLSTASTSLAVTASTTYSQSFSYSPTGRILMKSDLGTTTYTYYTSADAGLANPQAMKTAGTATSTYTYDNRGNQKTGGWFSHFWDYRGHLYVNVPVTSQFGIDSNGNTYSYDEADKRVKVAEALNQVVVRSTYYPSTSYASSTNGTIVHYIYLGDNTLLTTVEKVGVTTTTRYNHNDHLGSTGIVTNITGQLDETMDYAPFGSPVLDITTVGGRSEKHKYTGHIEDTNVGLSYMGARYYDGKLGRFLSQDPVFRDLGFDLADPQSMNSYAYARNNPMVMVDKDGEMFEYFAIKAYQTAHSYINTTPNIPHGIREADFMVSNIASHPSLLREVVGIRDGSTLDVSSIASNFAINMTLGESYGPNQGLEGTERNALRHTIWQGLVTKKFDENTATKMGDAHEDNPLSNLSNRTYSTLESADQTVDLLNNQIGRNIASESPWLSSQDIAQQSLDYFHEKGLYMAQKGKDGSYNVVKTKLSTDLYNQSSAELHRLNNKGKRIIGTSN